MEELNLIELLSYYFKKLPIIVVITLFAVMLGIFYSMHIQVPMYHGVTSVVLVQKNTNANTAFTQSELTLGEKLVSTYSEIIKSRRVLSQVIEELKLNCSVNELAKKINVTSLSETAIIKITVSDESNTMAATIANETAKVFSNEVSDIYNLENVSVLDEAIIEENPYNVNFAKQILLCTFGGFILSCVLIFLIYYFDNTVKSKKEIETKFNLPVLGEMPVGTKYTESKTQKSNKSTKDMTFDLVDKNVEAKEEKKTTRTTRKKDDKDKKEDK